MEIQSKPILSLFSDSFIGSALTLDPTENIIDLTLPEITPSLISYIHDMVSTEMIPGPYVDPIIVGYLAMDILSVVSDPYYESYAQANPHINLLHINTNYYEILIHTIQYNFPVVSSYLFHVTDPTNMK